MEGRRVTRKNQKYNPLFILFLCLTAAVAILLILSIVLGIRLGGVNKKLKASDAEVKELTATVSRLQAELADAKKGSSGTSAPPLPSESTTDPAQPAAGDTQSGSASWLDLSGHSEVKVKPTNLLDAYATYYTTAGVNLRGGPGTTYDRITTVDYGEKVQVAARENGWSFVKYENRFGWISSDYLSTTQPSPQTTTARTNTSNSSTRSEATSGSLRR